MMKGEPVAFKKGSLQWLLLDNPSVLSVKAWVQNLSYAYFGL